MDCKTEGHDRELPPTIQDQVNQVRGFGKLASLLRLLTRFGVGGERLKNIVDSVKDIEQQMDALVEMTNAFHTAFSEQGWLWSESTNVEIAKAALEAHESGDLSEAEEILASEFEGDHLDFVITRMCQLQPFSLRREQLEEALALTCEDRYIASVPLLLIVADGVVTDEFGKSFFADGVDLEEINSFAGQPDALPKLISEICRTRRRTSRDSLDFPYRNGIIHGRDLGYNNHIVNAKCWSLLRNLADLIRARRSEDNRQLEPQPSIREVLADHGRIQDFRRRIEEWSPRPENNRHIQISPEMLASMVEGEPETDLARFLIAWKAGNYGRMAEATVDDESRSINGRAGAIRELMRGSKLDDAAITRVNDIAAAVTEASVDLTLRSGKHSYYRQFEFRMICHRASGETGIHGEGNTYWRLFPNYQYKYWGYLPSDEQP